MTDRLIRISERDIAKIWQNKKDFIEIDEVHLKFISEKSEKPIYNKFHTFCSKIEINSIVTVLCKESNKKYNLEVTESGDSLDDMQITFVSSFYL